MKENVARFHELYTQTRRSVLLMCDDLNISVTKCHDTTRELRNRSLYLVHEQSFDGLFDTGCLFVCLFHILFLLCGYELPALYRDILLSDIYIITRNASAR